MLQVLLCDHYVTLFISHNVLPKDRVTSSARCSSNCFWLSNDLHPDLTSLIQTDNKITAATRHDLLSKHSSVSPFALTQRTNCLRSRQRMKVLLFDSFRASTNKPSQPGKHTRLLLNRAKQIDCWFIDPVSLSHWTVSVFSLSRCCPVIFLSWSVLWRTSRITFPEKQTWRSDALADASE